MLYKKYKIGTYKLNNKRKYIRKKKYNKIYANSLTIRQKNINENRAITFLLVSLLFGATYAFVMTSNNFTIDGEFVSANAVAQTQVNQQSVGDVLNLPSASPQVVVSAYSEYDSCHYPKIVDGVRKCLTASGKIAEHGMIATNLHPFGTKIEINGIGYTVEDRISKRYNNRYDIWQGYGEEGYAKATNWGLKTLPVKIKK